MKNPFPKNPVFQQFLNLKEYFRLYTTRETQKRTLDLIRIARIIQQSGDPVAFDLLGSINFGMAEDKSDVDMVFYLDCQHKEEATYQNTPRLRFYETLVLTSLVHEVSEQPFHIEIVDCINLGRLRYLIDNEIWDDDLILRFVFYRTICRGVNKSILRDFEKAIMDKEVLFKNIENQLTEYLVEFTKTHGHRMSFEKYKTRLQDRDIKIPGSIFEKLSQYLTQSRISD